MDYIGLTIAWYVASSGAVDGYINGVTNSYGRNSPDTYMGGSGGVMQVADYGEILFETWLNSSYGIWKKYASKSL